MQFSAGNLINTLMRIFWTELTQYRFKWRTVVLISKPRLLMPKVA